MKTLQLLRVLEVKCWYKWTSLEMALGKCTQNLKHYHF